MSEAGKNGEAKPMLDYPTAWEIQKTANLDHTSPVCSAVQTNGAFLCDCGAIEREWEARNS